jgi:hypothetical protein
MKNLFDQIVYKIKNNINKQINEDKEYINSNIKKIKNYERIKKISKLLDVNFSENDTLTYFLKNDKHLLPILLNITDDKLTKTVYRIDDNKNDSEKIKECKNDFAYIIYLYHYCSYENHFEIIKHINDHSFTNIQELLLLFINYRNKHVFVGNYTIDSKSVYKIRNQIDMIFLFYQTKYNYTYELSKEIDVYPNDHSYLDDLNKLTNILSSMCHLKGNIIFNN